MVNELAKIPQWGQTELEICRFIKKPLRFLEEGNQMPRLVITPKRFREYNLLVAEHKHIYDLIKELSSYSYVLQFHKYLVPTQYELVGKRGEMLGCIEIIKVGNAFLQFLQANKETFDKIINDSERMVAVSLNLVVYEHNYPKRISARFRYRPRGFKNKIKYSKSMKLPKTFQELWDLDKQSTHDWGHPRISIKKKLLPRYDHTDYRRIKINFLETHPTKQDYLTQFIQLLSELYENQKSEVDLDGYLNTWAKRILHDFEQGNVRL